MGAKTWMLVGGDGDAREVLRSKPALDRAASAALARRLFPSEKLEPLEDGCLASTNPPDDELVVGCFPGLAVVAAREFGLDHPSRLSEAFLQPALGRTIYLHAMHSVVDWFAYAVWRDGTLQRSLSLSPDSGVLEDLGTRLPFEEPYWEGRHPVGDPEEGEDGYPLAFHPLELAEAALLELIGYQLEGAPDAGQVDPYEVPMLRFKRARPWWRRW